MGNRITLELECDKLSPKGLDALQVLLGESATGWPTSQPVIPGPVASSTVHDAAVKLIRMLEAEVQGNQLKIINGYIRAGRPYLSHAELVAAMDGKFGPVLAGTLSSLTKNWRKAGMPGRTCVQRDWMNQSKVPGAFWLGAGDAVVFQALVAASTRARAE